MHLGMRALLAFAQDHADEPALVMVHVIGTEGSSYRKPGAMMLIAADHSYAGLISGGCLEGDLVLRANEVFADGKARRVTYDMHAEDDLLWGLGLGCDGVVHLLLHRLDRPERSTLFGFVSESLAAQQRVALAVLSESSNEQWPAGTVAAFLPDDTAGVRSGADTRPDNAAVTIADKWGDQRLIALCRRALSGKTFTGADGDTFNEQPSGPESAQVLEGNWKTDAPPEQGDRRKNRHWHIRLPEADNGRVEEARSDQTSSEGTMCSITLIEPAPRILLCGAGPDAVPLARMMDELGWQCTVVDHRSGFARQDRFPAHTDVRCARPEQLQETLKVDNIDAAVIMSHNLEHDANYLRQLAVARETGSLRYLGALGPVKRRQRLLDMAGYPALSINGPIGLDIGAELPESIALAITAEIHAALNGRDGQSLTEKAAKQAAPLGSVSDEAAFVKSTAARVKPTSR